MDKSRQKFEEWFAPQKEEMKNNGLGMISITRMYQRQLSAWQASRESLINSLEPVGYIDNAEFSELQSSRVCYLYKDSIDKINIPLYRLDK
ncbi:Uncharacterised protein [Providencia rustigianii]|nr:Uncharacterised protein [Providencia rustigianii]